MEFLSGIDSYVVDIIFGILTLTAAFLILRLIIAFLKNWWLDESQAKFAAGIEYVLLEIKFPKDNETFPKAMEQVFASFYQIYSFGIKPEKKWLEGQFEEKISAEMISSREGIRFFLRTNKKNRPLVESAIFAEYPGAEIVEVMEDYVKKFPPDLPNAEYDIMGADMILGKDSAYPIKTYPYFFGERKYEEQEVDPIAHLAEVMSGLKSDEHMWIQVIISPAGDDLKNAAKKIIAEKSGKKEGAKKGFGGELLEFTHQAVLAPIKYPEWGDAVKPEEKPKSVSAQDAEIIRAVDAKATKLAFNTIVRIIYIDKKDSFSGNNFKAAISTFQQFNIQNLNFIRPAALTMTIPSRFYIPHKKQILFKKKKEIYTNYIKRDFTAFTNVEEMYKKHLNPSIFNVEELATIFHPPIGRVAATGLGQPASKKGAPPVNLPIG
ncbi:MAG: hypothetical protein WC519_02290 [Parcubacteria group bacterium]